MRIAQKSKRKHFKSHGDGDDDDDETEWKIYWSHYHDMLDDHYARSA